MPIFDAGTIVRVPFPYTDGERVQFRPALIVSRVPLGPEGKQFWAVMITSAANRGWPDDIAIEGDYAEVGLTAPSVIRPHKVATLDGDHATLLGRLDPERLAAVMSHIRCILV
ncbi:type II toxin-antitoxin system PemK/MazF family toxin [Sphingomonas sp.]|uniref:type II toxin-antitoxin system PemK/MazF family toxin n=1 Tax=Sphingomonas sp. TaxID=28214 RepID=UPI0035BC69BA